MKHIEFYEMRIKKENMILIEEFDEIHFEGELGKLGWFWWVDVSLGDIFESFFGWSAWWRSEKNLKIFLEKI